MQFSRLSAIWSSFHSSDLYRDVALRWKGIGVLYLLLLLAITWLPSGVRWYSGVRNFVATEAPPVVKQLPVVSIKGGVMTANPPGRHVIKLGTEKGRPVEEGGLIIDDTIDTIPEDVRVPTFIVTRRQAAMIQPAKSERRVWTLDQASDMVITPEGVDHFLNSLARWIAPVGYVCAVLGALVFRVLQALLYGAFTTIYASRKSVTLNYATAIRLCAVAVTPVVIIRTLIWFGPWEPAWYWRWPVAIAITAGYIAFAIRSVAESRATATGV